MNSITTIANPKSLTAR